MLHSLSFVGSLARGLQSGVEVGDVGSEGFGVEVDRGAVRQQERSRRCSGWFQLMAQGGEGGAEAVSAGVGFTLRPEHLDEGLAGIDRKSTRLNSSHVEIS